MVDIECAKLEAMHQYMRRCIASDKIKKICNSDLVAGSPMYFYCEDCGILIERLPEDYLFCPYKRCSQCKGLEEQNWLKDAKGYINEKLFRMVEGQRGIG